MKSKEYNEFLEKNRDFLESLSNSQIKKATEAPDLMAIEKKLDQLISLLSKPKTILITGDEVERLMISLQSKVPK